MAKKKVSKKAKRRLALFGTLAVFTIVYFIFTFVTTINDLYKLKTEQQTLTENLNELKTNASSLKTEINKLQDKDYVARYARENYLYTKNGEYVIKSDKKETKKTKKTAKINEDYIIYGCSATAVFIILFIIVHHKRAK